jgi:alpha-D-xyloside xylohydrolase
MFSLFSLLLLSFFILRASSLSSPPYASWAHSHFVWLSSDGAGCTPAANFDLLDAYAAHNITVGAIDIDSGWATGYNTFAPRAELYPDFNGFISQVHARGVRVILWMTSMIDADSPNFADALARGAFVRDGFGEQAVSLKWWHGTGGLLDYTNATTRAWWEAQMAAHVLAGGGSGGIDGWKCDGTDPYIIELVTPRGSNNEPITFADYSAWYYNHSLFFTRTLKPDALIWSRPVDAFPITPNVSAFLEYSPKNVMFAGWVGDQDPTFEGLRAALINILESAWRNYTNFGSDTGGCAFSVRARRYESARPLPPPK